MNKEKIGAIILAGIISAGTVGNTVAFAEEISNSENNVIAKAVEVVDGDVNADQVVYSRC